MKSVQTKQELTSVSGAAYIPLSVSELARVVEVKLSVKEDRVRTLLPTRVIFHHRKHKCKACEKFLLHKHKPAYRWPQANYERITSLKVGHSWKAVNSSPADSSKQLSTPIYMLDKIFLAVLN